MWLVKITMSGGGVQSQTMTRLTIVLIVTNHKNTFCSLKITNFLSFCTIPAEDDDEDDIRVEELGDEDDDEEDDDEDDDEEEGVNEAFIAVRTSHIEYTYSTE